jgi:hypothetical protein
MRREGATRKVKRQREFCWSGRFAVGARLGREERESRGQNQGLASARGVLWPLRLSCLTRLGWSEFAVGLQTRLAPPVEGRCGCSGYSLLWHSARRGRREAAGRAFWPGRDGNFRCGAPGDGGRSEKGEESGVGAMKWPSPAARAGDGTTGQEVATSHIRSAANWKRCCPTEPPD